MLEKGNKYWIFLFIAMDVSKSIDEQLLIWKDASHIQCRNCFGGWNRYCENFIMLNGKFECIVSKQVKSAKSD